MSKKVKLGETANSFYDPVTQVKVLPNQVVELDKAQLRSKKIAVALRHGHLALASEEEIEEFEKNGNLESTGTTGAEETNWDEFDDYDEKSLMKLSKSKLVELALHLESEISEDELNEMTKAELTEEILDINEEKES